MGGGCAGWEGCEGIFAEDARGGRSDTGLPTHVGGSLESLVDQRTGSVASCMIVAWTLESMAAFTGLEDSHMP